MGRTRVHSVLMCRGPAPRSVGLLTPDRGCFSMSRFARNCAVCLSRLLRVWRPQPRSFDQVVHRGRSDCDGSQSAQQFRCGAEVGLASGGCLWCGDRGRCAEYWSAAAGALWHTAGSRRGIARADRLSSCHGVGIGHRWPLTLMILSLAYLWEAGMMLMWSTLRGRAGSCCSGSRMR
jgi:hypothetical protein